MTILHTIGEFLRNVLLQVPLPVVRAMFVAIPSLLLIWVLCLPRSATTPSESTGRWGENLKVGAVLALGLQILIYLLM